MVQSISWEWLLEGFIFDLETGSSPKTVEHYLTPVRVFVRWAKDGGQVNEPLQSSKRYLKQFSTISTRGQGLCELAIVPQAKLPVANELSGPTIVR